MPFALAVVAIRTLVSCLIDTYIVVVSRALAKGTIGVFVAGKVATFSPTLGVGSAASFIALLAASVRTVALVVAILFRLGFRCTDWSVSLGFFEFRFNMERVVRAGICVYLTFS